MCTQKVAMKPEICPTSQTLWCRPHQATALRPPQARPICQGNFKGVVSHYHLTNRKIDCAGLDINKLLREIEDGN